METLFPRFPHLSQEVFDSVDNQSLLKCQEVSLPWCEFLQKQKFYQIRIIKSIIEQFHEVGDAWKKVFKSATTRNIMDLGTAVDLFYHTSTQIKDSSPHHVVAGKVIH
jgi:hypothetical protein